MENPLHQLLEERQVPGNDPNESQNFSFTTGNIIIACLGIEIIIGLANLTLAFIEVEKNRKRAEKEKLNSQRVRIPPICKTPNCGLIEIKILDTGESVCARGHKWRDIPDIG